MKRKGVVVLIFRQNRLKVCNKKQGHYVMVKGLIQEEDIILIQ